MTKREPRFFTSSILPVSERHVLKGGTSTVLPLRVRIGYFHHPKLGHTLIDTGYGPLLTRPPEKQSLALKIYKLIFQPTIVNNDPLGNGLALLGLRKNDIETVIITHFHADHICGLVELPDAHIWCSRAAWNAYRPGRALKNAISGVFCELLPKDMAQRLHFFDDLNSLPAPFKLGMGKDLCGDGSVLSVELPGHLDGHVGLCFTELQRPLLYATDTQWLVRSILEDRCPGIPASLTYRDVRAARQSVEKVKAFAESGGDVMLCHDPDIRPYDIDALVETMP